MTRPETANSATDEGESSTKPGVQAAARTSLVLCQHFQQTVRCLA